MIWGWAVQMSLLPTCLCLSKKVDFHNSLFIAGRNRNVTDVEGVLCLFGEPGLGGNCF